MTIKQIKDLAFASYTNDKLDEKKINRVIKLFSRSQLKEYIKILKKVENNKKVTVFLPNVNEQNGVKRTLAKIFRGKEILLKEDKKLIAGFKIVNNDDIYDFNLRNNLENLVSYINP